MDPLWIGVIGTGIGALATGLPTLGTAIVNSITARGQREHDATEAKAKREDDAAEAKLKREHEETIRRRQVAADLLEHRRATVANWREQLRVTRNEHDAVRSRGGYVSDGANVVGEEWFEELRSHLTGEAAELYREDGYIFIDNEALTTLSLEIGRIEREWIAEAQG